jgi:DNA-binding CsgD family transcriptional regulator
MLHAIPLEAFDAAGEAVLCSDAQSIVRLINRPAELLLGCDRERVLGQRCWNVARLRYANGAPFCGPECPVRKLARDGERVPRAWLVRQRRGKRPLALELFTVVVPAKIDRPHSVLHLIAPALVPVSWHRGRGGDSSRTPKPVEVGGRLPRGAHRVDADSQKVLAGAVSRLSLLSPREREVLELLGTGFSTRAISVNLGISDNTVRNHVRSILDKLKVHRRIEAALVWMHHTGHRSIDGTR